MGWLKAAQDFFKFERAVRGAAKALPKPIKIVITQDTLPWLDLLCGVVASGATVEQVRHALWQAGLYDELDYPTYEDRVRKRRGA